MKQAYIPIKTRPIKTRLSCLKTLTLPTDFEMSRFIVYKEKYHIYSITNFEKEAVSGKKTISLAILKIQTSKKSPLETSMAGKWIVFMFHASFFPLSTETLRVSPNNLTYLSNSTSMVVYHSFGP